jgi:hypothetical protein
MISYNNIMKNAVSGMLRRVALVRTDVPPKCCFLHGVTSEKTAFFIVTAMKTSNLRTNITSTKVMSKDYTHNSECTFSECPRNRILEVAAIPELSCKIYSATLRHLHTVLVTTVCHNIASN